MIVLVMLWSGDGIMKRPYFITFLNCELNELNELLGKLELKNFNMNFLTEYDHCVAQWLASERQGRHNWILWISLNLSLPSCWLAVSREVNRENFSVTLFLGNNSQHPLRIPTCLESFSCILHTFYANYLLTNVLRILSNAMSKMSFLLPAYLCLMSSCHSSIWWLDNWYQWAAFFN